MVDVARKLEGIILAKNTNSFETYLQDRYYNEIFGTLKSYIYQNRTRLNLSSYTVPDPSYTALEDFHIMGVSFRNTEDDTINFHAVIQADITISGKGRRDYDKDNISSWFSVSFTGLLRGGLSKVTITDVSDYTKERFNAEDALTRYLVPYMFSRDLDAHAESFLNKYCPRSLEKPMPLPINEILEAMGLTLYQAPLPDGIFGRTYFANADVEIYNHSHDVVEERIEGGTILVDPDVFFMRNIGSLNNTIIHECVHWDKHFKFFELQQLLNPEYHTISCAVVEDYQGKSDPIVSELDWMEWQANALAPKILMPAKTTWSKLNLILDSVSRAFPSTRSGELMQLAISELADFFQVSTFSAKLRAIELGFDQAAGTFNYVEGQYYQPFSFKKGTLKKDQTFIVDKNNAIFESAINPDLAAAVREGLIIYASGMFVINDPKYVQITDKSVIALTDYAMDHVDECCLVFERKNRVSRHYDDSYYRRCFLCRDVDSKCFVEATCDAHSEQNEDVKKRAAGMASIKEEAERIKNILVDLPSSFAGALSVHIQRRGYTNEDMEERTDISEKTIREYRNNHEAKPELPSVLALCIGLNLHPSLAYDLVDKAGHNIFIPAPANLVYQYLINNHHMENIEMWNEKLNEADIPQRLPSNRKK